MPNPTKCPTCNGKYKKCGPVFGPAREGSKYFQCQECWNVLEITAEGYEFVDKGPEPKRLAEKRRAAEREQKRREEEAARWRLPRPWSVM